MNTVTPHDLLRVEGAYQILSEDLQPKWVAESLARVPLVVVRRGPLTSGMVPIGVRGRTRCERFAAVLLKDAIVERVRPEQLAQQRSWKLRRGNDATWVKALEEVDEMLATSGYVWGPIGSVGFELATGSHCTTAMSDLDLIVRAPTPMPREGARELLSSLQSLPVRIDVAIETPFGAIALAEYARGETLLLLRSAEGPKLTTDPWANNAGGRAT